MAGRPLASDLTFDIGAGEVVGLCGRSGCGKTSLALALLRLLPEDLYHVRGSVRLRGQDLLALDEREMESIRGASISMVFQDPLAALNPVMRVRDQVCEVIRAHRVAQPPEQLFVMAGLTPSARILDAYPHQLSGGERQRVCLVLALAAGPLLVLADEPFTALDAPRILELGRLFRGLTENLGTSFLLIGHQRAVLSKLADRVWEMRDGRLHAL